MTNWGAAWLRTIEPRIAMSARAQASTRRSLRAARIQTFPEWYLAISYLVAAGAGILVTVAATAALAAAIGLSRALLLGFAVGATCYLLVRVAFLIVPRMRASSRRKRIDADLPGVLLLAYALSRGGMGPVEVFRAVADERRTYGEASREFALVVRDVDWFGLDVNAALAGVARSTPSQELATFLDGLVTILTSGAQPADYFQRQAEAYASRAELRLERDLDQAGLAAELYVSALMVLPLLLVVILSVLSVLSGAATDFVPLIVFALMPLGTIAYLVFVDMLLPSEPLPKAIEKRAGRDDFGFDVAAPVPANGRAALSREFLMIGAAIAASAILALGVLLATRNPLAAMGAALVLGTAVVAARHEIRVRRGSAIDGALPETLSRLAGFNERGVGILQAFHILDRSGQGPLDREMSAVSRDMRWNGSLQGALRRMRERVGTPRVQRLGVLLERASNATGDLNDVLSVAARDAASTEHLRERRRGAMMSYIVVIYVVFGVFLYIVATVASLFYGGGGLATAAGSATAHADPAASRMLFFQAALLQAACGGLVAGRLGEGYVLSGLKHAAILMTAAWLVFQWTVFT